jgi:hypothetical protein
MALSGQGGGGGGGEKMQKHLSVVAVFLHGALDVWGFTCATYCASPKQATHIVSRGSIMTFCT